MCTLKNRQRCINEFLSYQKLYFFRLTILLLLFPTAIKPFYYLPEGKDSSAFSINLVDGKKFVAFDKTGKELFEVFAFDNGPDYPSEDLFRIVADGKIGFADLNGKIVIKPRFYSVYPFENGLAAFCEGCDLISADEHSVWIGGKWGFIRKDGSIAIPAIFDSIIKPFRNGIALIELDGKEKMIDKNGKPLDISDGERQWITLAARAFEFWSQLYYGKFVCVVAEWQESDDFVFNKNSDRHILTISLYSDHNKILRKFEVIPRQNFSLSHKLQNNSSPADGKILFTVTEYGIVFTSYGSYSNNKKISSVISDFEYAAGEIFEKTLNEEISASKPLLPENIVVLSTETYKNYSVINIALPGTELPPETEWFRCDDGKMLLLKLTPDLGPIKSRWIKTRTDHADSYYASVEDQLLNLFSNSLFDAIEKPDLREIIFDSAVNNFSSIFNAANSWVNYLSDKYKNRLRNWLFLSKEAEEEIVLPENFSDYQTKTTEDKTSDYMPELNAEVSDLPASEMMNLNELLQRLEVYQTQAIENHGTWLEGNIVLGENPFEYKPSKPELLASETGDRIAGIPGIVIYKQCPDIGYKKTSDALTISYKKFTFSHTDVMGSERFFHIESINEIMLIIPESFNPKIR